MTEIAEIKSDALNILHTTANALHAQLAALLAQAGHFVSDGDHLSTLIGVAVKASAATGAPVGSNTAPNYADHALATFTTSLTAALLEFGQKHLPAKFQPLAAEAVNDIGVGIEAGAAQAAASDDAAPSSSAPE